MSRRTVRAEFPDPYLQPTMSVESAADFLGLGRTQAYAAAKRGDIPMIRVGRRVLVPTALLARHLGLFVAGRGKACAGDQGAEGKT